MNNELTPEKKEDAGTVDSNKDCKQAPSGQECLFDKFGQTDTKELAQYILKRILSCQPTVPSPKAVDLTHGQEILLRRLFSLRENGVEPKMSDLSVMLGSTKSAASQAISKLERMGLVKRKWSKSDRRRILVGLTPKGVALAEVSNKDILEFIQSRLNKMDKDEIRIFISVFEKCMI